MTKYMSTKIIDWNIQDSNKEIPFWIFLKENYFGENKFNKRADKWSCMNWYCSKIFKISFIAVCFVRFDSVINVFPFKLPIKWNDEKIESPCQLRRMNGQRKEPFVVMAQHRKEQTNPWNMESPVAFHQEKIFWFSN